jgi:hypothetical protein
VASSGFNALFFAKTFGRIVFSLKKHERTDAAAEIQTKFKRPKANVLPKARIARIWDYEPE